MAFPSHFGRTARWITVLFAGQAMLFYLLPGVHSVPLPRPLTEFPAEIGNWRSVQEGVVDEEVRDVLRADDLLTRTYVSAVSGIPANLFVAFFETQSEGQAPHSPKNCLPGSGWVPTRSGTVTLHPADGSPPVTVNRYLVSRGDQHSLVLYWYQSKYRVVASEYFAKIYLVADSMVHRRTDTSLVRIVTPVAGGDSTRAEEMALDLARVAYPAMRDFWPE
jgi:EpsI family protein